MKIAALLPHHPAIGHRLLEKNLTKKEIGNLIDTVYRHCGQKATVIFADQIMGLGFTRSGQGRHLLRQGRHRHPRSARSRSSTRPASWSRNTSSSTPTA